MTLDHPTTARRFRRLDSAAFASRLTEPGLCLLDCRDGKAYACEHIDGARRLDGDNVGELIQTLNRRQPVLIYCYRGNASQVYAQMFADFGFSDVADLVGGFEAWSAGAACTHPELDRLSHWLRAEGFTDKDARAAYGNTPLMHAAWRGAHDIVERLLAAGVRQEAVNADGNTALWLACVQGDLSLITRLVLAGVPLDHQNDNGATCLMYAASASKPEVVRILLELGADPALQSLDGMSALDMAASIECLQLLRAAGKTAGPG